MRFQNMCGHQDISGFQQINDLPPFPKRVLSSLTGIRAGPCCGTHHALMHTGKKFRDIPVIYLPDKQQMEFGFKLNVFVSGTCLHPFQEFPHYGNITFGYEGKCHSQRHGLQPDTALVVLDNRLIIYGRYISTGLFLSVNPAILFQLIKRFPDNRLGHTELFTDHTFTDFIMLFEMTEQNLFSYILID